MTQAMLHSHIHATNFLSFGPSGIDLPLRGLNVLIGANGSGKLMAPVRGTQL